MYNKLKETLDQHVPGWYIEWADQTDLVHYARTHSELMLRTRVERKLFHAILHAAIEAGMVTEVAQGL